MDRVVDENIRHDPVTERPVFLLDDANDAQRKLVQEQPRVLC